MAHQRGNPQAKNARRAISRGAGTLCGAAVVWFTRAGLWGGLSGRGPAFQQVQPGGSAAAGTNVFGLMT